MYEAELNKLTEPVEVLPPEVVKRFSELSDKIGAKTALPWGEHCTECNAPVCYTSCELYSPRADRGCRLFIDGVVRVDSKGSINPYLLKIRFKRWGKLWSVGNLRLFSATESARNEHANLRRGALTRSLPLPPPWKAHVLKKVSYWRRNAAEHAGPSSESPDCFLLECYNPGARKITLTFTIRPRDQASARCYQRLIHVPPGFVREEVPVSEIHLKADLAHAFNVEIVPNEADDTLLYFGCLDFVKAKVNHVAKPENRTEPSARKWKCIVWDLDHTLWDGTLIEDGPEKIRIRQGVVDIIKETDRRGILHSVASKNNHEDAMKVLRQHRLEEYFLYPQISWQPKSQSISRIAQLLNIGVDSLVFVDDQQFERAEVQSSLPHVNALDSADFATIVDRPECQLPVTEESKQRRLMYREQQHRNVSLEAYSGDYRSFLKDCKIELSIARLDEGNLERVYELAQRTNQMNFSGNRYPRNQLQELMRSEGHETFVIRCTDRFGSYGLVGFAVVDLREPRLLDLMFSCRIQGKRVEHAFLAHLLQKYVRSQARDFFVNYRKTSKNEAAGKVFDEMFFERVQDNDGVLSLVFRKDREIPCDHIISINPTEGVAA